MYSENFPAGFPDDRTAGERPLFEFRRQRRQALPGSFRNKVKNSSDEQDDCQQQCHSLPATQARLRQGNDGERDDSRQRGAPRSRKQNRGPRKNQVHPVNPYHSPMILNQQVVRHRNAQGNDQPQVVGIQFGACITLVDRFLVGKKKVDGVYSGYKRSENIGAHQMHLFLHSRSQFPDQPNHREQLEIGECFDHCPFRKKTPEVTQNGQRDKKRHYNVSNRRFPHLSTLQDCERPQPKSYHPDQAHAGAKSRDRDGVFPGHRKHQQPERAKRNFSKRGKLLGSCKQAGKSAGKGKSRPRRKTHASPRRSSLPIRMAEHRFRYD